MNSRDLYLRYRDPTGRARDIVREVRVWDPALYLKSELEEHARLAQDKDKAPDFRVVTVATREEYLDQRRERVIA